MTWAKLDDGFWVNPKVVTAGNAAAGAFARMLSYCGNQDTDGHIPTDIARFIGTPKQLRELSEAGLIEQTPNGWLIPDYLEFNPSRAEVEAKRKARSEAGKRGGKRSALARANGEANA